jgi:hypothetical protein
MMGVSIAKLRMPTARTLAGFPVSKEDIQIEKGENHEETRADDRGAPGVLHLCRCQK